MGWPLKSSGAKVVLIVTMLIWAVLPAAAECAAEPLGVIPTKINIRSKSIIEALLELGQTSSVCFGIEIRDDRLARTPVAWTEPGPVGKLVESALSDAKGYKLHRVDLAVGDR
jgi:hypothetical protein